MKYAEDSANVVIGYQCLDCLLRSKTFSYKGAYYHTTRSKNSNVRRGKGGAIVWRIEQNLIKLDRLFSLVKSLPFDGEAALKFGQIRAYLASQGTPIGPYDLQIAAIACAHDLILVTHNTREFSRVPDLILEDWEIS